MSNRKGPSVFKIDRKYKKKKNLHDKNTVISISLRNRIEEKKAVLWPRGIYEYKSTFIAESDFTGNLAAC